MSNTPESGEFDPNERWLDLENLDQEQSSEEVPHSGSDHLPEDMREYPTQEFDKTPLEQAVNDGALSTPEDAATLPDQMPSVDDSESFDASHVDTPIEPVKKKWHQKTASRITAASLLIGAGIGLVINNLDRGSEDANEQTPVEEASSNDAAALEQEPSAPTDGMDEDSIFDTNEEAQPSENTAEESGPENHYPSLSNPEVINLEHEHVLLDSDDPDELAFQIFQNFSAAENSNHQPTELSATHALFGDTHISSHLVTGFQEHISMVREYTSGMRRQFEDRGEDPYAIQYGFGDTTLQQPDSNSRILLIPIRKDYSPINHSDNDIAKLMEFKLERSSVEAENISYLSDSDEPIWVVREFGTVSDYEIPS